ncbi:hypothetical protein [Roseomonas genomospecies 6]|uniref:hypothetical protein n=1 Tax=Roseomonas genomospecies 6 TaxID=214106 RepID=UPI0011F3D4F1|nr:hypothetical protein [Roseomonas genomospecies 6]
MLAFSATGAEGLARLVCPGWRFKGCEDFTVQELEVRARLIRYGTLLRCARLLERRFGFRHEWPVRA